ncbi:tRNA (adenosine(37)-N6)-dimethylallyltransferase MiaA [Haloferula chungangensis]|uniref:tRNA dimethylallyltransferase n=1 Tax=Haloferula chungangensis TaxID=1048331 RepID=A0ABW2L1L4_9BACT
MPSLHPIYLCGPTASGKSSLAIALARQLGGEVVNADAFQLYQGLEILTAAPSAEEQSSVPHHLYGVLTSDQTCDAMRYRSLALPVIEEIISRNAVPIVTGGSGLYLKFLTHGPSPLPTGDHAYRETLAPLSLEELAARLQVLDPVEASRTDLQNRRYLTRAIEICELSGQPCSALRDRWETITREVTAGLRGLFIQRERPDLHRRINLRTTQMLDGGAPDEVRNLAGASSTFEKAIGFREITALNEGRLSREECTERIQAATRQYAKRQETWFRREDWLRPLLWAPDSPMPLEAALEILGVG